MKTVDYVVNRDDIYIGVVVECFDNILSLNKKDGGLHPKGLGIHIKAGQLYIPNGRFLRMMLFTPTKDGMADDLQWNSEKYPVLEMRSRSKLVDIPNCGIAIDGCCNLGKLLKHFNYSDRLDNDGIAEVVRSFFTSDFIFDNCNLFGYKEIHPRELGHADYDMYIPDTFNFWGKPVIYRNDDVAYVKNSDGVLPSEIFEFLCAARPLSNLGRDISMRKCGDEGISANKFEPDGVEFERGLVRVLAPRNKKFTPVIFN